MSVAQGEKRQPDMQKLVALARRASEGRRENPYRSSLKRFLELCYTKDEGRAGKVRHFPVEWPYWDTLIEDVMTEPLLLIEKSRRVMASWFMCAFDLWLIAGGYDPRWPILMPTDENPNGENRQVILAARKLEDIQGSSWFLHERIAFLYRQLVERGYTETHWPGFPEIKFTFNRASASNGGRIDAVPQGPDVFRGAGATAVHAEEMGHWTQLKDSITGAKMVLQGGGHWLGLTTPNAASYCADIALDRIEPDEPYDMPASRAEILPKRYTRAGWAITTIKWTSVPGYDYKEAARGLDEAGRRMELDCDWTATKGRRVFPEFSAEKHISLEPLEFDPDLPLHIGIDVPGTPAAVFTQVNSYGQWLILSSLSPPESKEIGVWEFGQMIADHLLTRYAAPHDLDIDDLKLVFVGDPAGQYRPSRTAARRQETRSAWEVLRVGSQLYMGPDEEPIEREGWGWQIIEGLREITKRQEAVRLRLTTLISGGLTALVVCKTATFVQNMFLGGYRYQEHEDGSFSREPLKDGFSHTADALCYVAGRLTAQPVSSRRRDSDEDARPAYASAASGRHRSARR